MQVYFHLKDPTEMIIDVDGLEVINLKEAQVQALEAVEELRQNDQTTAQSFSGWTLEVADGSGRVLFSLDLAPRVFHS